MPLQIVPAWSKFRLMYTKLRLMHCFGGALFLLPLGATSLQAQPIPSAAAPQHLSASPSSGTIILTWSQVAGAEAYRVSYASSPDGPFAQAAEIHGTRYVVRGLTNWVPHYYVVTAVRRGQAGASSRSICATPDGPFAAPQGLHTHRGHTQASLTWQPVPGVDGYTIYRSRDADPKIASPKSIALTPAETQVAVGVASCVWTDSGLTDGVAYHYRIAARISANLRSSLSAGSVHPTPLTGPASSVATVTPIAGLPLAPASLKVAAGDQRVTLTWPSAARLAASGSSEVTYRVYQGTRSGGEAPKPIRAGLSSASLLGSGLTNWAKYYYFVTAVNTAGESAFSPEQAATPTTPGVAVASASISGTDAGSGSPVITPLGGGQAPSASANGGAGAGASNGAANQANTTVKIGLGTAGGSGAPSPAPLPIPVQPPVPVNPQPPAPVSQPPVPVGPQPPVDAPAPVAPPAQSVPVATPVPPVETPTPVSPAPPISISPVTGGGDTSPGSPGGDVPGPPPHLFSSFYLTLSPGQARLAPGGTTTVTVTFASAVGFLGDITPSLGQLPPGVTAFFYPAVPALTAIVDGHSVTTATLYLTSAPNSQAASLTLRVSAHLDVPAYPYTANQFLTLGASAH